MKKPAAAERASGPNVAPSQANDRISLHAAARESGYNRNSLRAAIDDGRIRCIERQPWGDSDRIYLSRSELAEDLAQLPPCKTAGCEMLALAASGYCGEHFGESGRERAVIAELDVLASDRDWYLAREAARVAGVSLTTLNLDVRSGLLPSEKIGRHRRVTRDALREYRRLKASQPRPTTTSAEERDARRARIIELDRQGLTHAQIATKLHCDVHTVTADLDRGGAERKRRARPRKLTVEQLDQLPALYKAGAMLDELAAQFDVSPGQVRAQLERLGVQRRGAYKQSEHPPAVERACEHCGRRFMPRFPAADPRFHGAGCANAWQKEQARAVVKERGLLNIEETAARIGVNEQRVYQLVAGGLLDSELISYPRMIRPVHGIPDQEIRRYLQQRGGLKDPRRVKWLDPDHVIKHADATGATDRLERDKKITRAEAHDLIAIRVERRRVALARHQAGRKPATALHARWLDRYEHYLAERELELTERQATLARRRALGLEDEDDCVAQRDLKVPVVTAALDAVVEEDWHEHPEDWPRAVYPATRSGDFDPRNLSAARKRIGQALKRLQTPGTK